MKFLNGKKTIIGVLIILVAVVMCILQGNTIAECIKHGFSQLDSIMLGVGAGVAGIGGLHKIEKHMGKS